MIAAVPTAIAALSADGWGTAASTIMTTDTIAKGASRRVQTAQGEVTVTGIAKGVGMIEPHMATMLAFIATDARLSATAVDAALRGADIWIAAAALRPRNDVPSDRKSVV